MTSDSEEDVDTFVQQFDIPWSNAYGASLKTLVNLQAVGSGPGPGLFVKPTLYVIGRDRKVCWSDGQMRPKHEKAATIVSALEKAIEKALDENRVSQRTP